MNKLEFIPYKININEIMPKLNKYNLSANNQNIIFNEVKNYINIKKINIYENEDFMKVIYMEKKKSNEDNINQLKDSEKIIKKESAIVKRLKSNYIYIKDFVYKLCNSQENKNNQNGKKIDIGEESAMYNNLLFRFMDLISVNNENHEKYLEFLMKIMTYYRSKGFFIINESSYVIFVNIFSFILLNYRKSSALIKNIIILAQTFYKIDKNTNEKIFLLNGLRDHETLNNIETWHRVINYKLSLSIKNNNNYSLNIVNKKEYI
jgi:hypothetical protein